MTTSRPVTAALAAMATESRIRRWRRSSGFSAPIAAATSSGAATARGSSWSTAGRPQPLSWTSSCGSRVPNRFWAWTAMASSRAVTAASTTTSVRASAWTTGLTAGVRTGMS